jgi:xanthosine utilization system XapX-like protein
MGRLTMGGLFGRLLASLLLVFATYNPTGFSFVSWLAGNFPHVPPIQAVVGLVLLAVWIFFVHATWRSLGTLGVALGLAFFAAVIWLISSWGWLNTSSHTAMIWVALFFIACMLTVGLCWALIRVRVSGQPVVEEVDR